MSIQTLTLILDEPFENQTNLLRGAVFFLGKYIKSEIYY